MRDKEQREKVKEAAWNQDQITDASLLIILCGDLHAHEKDPDRYWQNAPDNVREQMVGLLKGFYDGKEALQRDEVMRSCGIAAQTIMLAAKGMGYDSCPMVGFDFEKVAEIIQLPSDHVISMIVVVGKALKEARPRAGQLSKLDVVVEDSF